MFKVAIFNVSLDLVAGSQRLNLAKFQGWRSGESTRLPLMWPGIDSRIRRHMWVEFVGSLLGSEWFFFGYSSGFPLSSETNISFDLFLFQLICSGLERKLTNYPQMLHL